MTFDDDGGIPPCPGTKASGMPTNREMNREESSMLGSFIHWVGTTKKPKKKKKVTRTSDWDSDSSINRHSTKTQDNDRQLHELGMKLKAVISNPSYGEVHFSRPTTPKTSAREPGDTADSEIDRYRIMYLLVKMEQQQEHVRHVIDTLKKANALQSRVDVMNDIKTAMSQMNAYLIGVRDNDPVTMETIGRKNEVDEFLSAVEQICEASAKIPVEGSDDVAALDKMMQVILVRNGKTKVKKQKKSPKQSMKAFFAEINKPKDISEVARQFHNTKEGLEKYRKKTKVHKADEAKTDDVRERKTINKRYKDRYTRTDDWPDTDTDEEMDNTISGRWPNLTRLETSKHQQEREIQCLMTEIDGLMNDSNLKKGYKKSHGISFEEVMMNGGEKKEKRNESRPSTPRLNQNQQKIKKPPTGARKSKSESDSFIEELDKLLDDCLL